MATNSTNLWQGNITMRTGLFVKSAYAEVSKHEIEIRKNSQESSAVLFRIARSQVTSLTTGKNDFGEVFIRGYQGFIVEFQNEGNKGKVRFWPKGFGQFPNAVEIPKLGAALAEFQDIPVETLVTAKMANSQNMIVLSAVAIMAIVACGAIPGIILGFSVYGATVIWQKESMDPSLRKVLAILLVVGALGFVFLLNFIAILARLEQ